MNHQYLEGSCRGEVVPGSRDSSHINPKLICIRFYPVSPQSVSQPSGVCVTPQIIKFKSSQQERLQKGYTSDARWHLFMSKGCYKLFDSISMPTIYTLGAFHTINQL